MNPPRAVPTPYQLGSRCRFCVHANTHGMARRSSTRIPPSPPPSSPPGRRDGREPIVSSPSSRIGLAATKYGRKSGSSYTSPR